MRSALWPNAGSISTTPSLRPLRPEESRLVTRIARHAGSREPARKALDELDGFLHFDETRITVPLLNRRDACDARRDRPAPRHAVLVSFCEAV
jgi:hypothetical protein